MDHRLIYDTTLERLRNSKTLSMPSSSLLEDLEIQDHLIPNGWTERGNVALCYPGKPVHVMQLEGAEPCHNSIVICCGGYRVPSAIVVWGNNSFVFFGENSHPGDLHIYCGALSSVFVLSDFMCTNHASINARNGGSVFVGKSNLWAENVRINTDDMHAIIDIDSGHRINRYGSTVELSDRVWLAAEVTVNPGASIGCDTVIGARSLVTGDIPANCVAVGVPARITRTGTKWLHEDKPPSLIVER